MEFIINNLQILKSHVPVDNRSLKQAMSGLIERNPTASNIRGSYQYYRNNKYKTKCGSLYFIAGSLFNERGELVGILGDINGYIQKHLQVNKYIVSSEIYLNGSQVDDKFIAVLKKYSGYGVNVLTETAFKNFCQASIDVQYNQETIIDIVENYLLGNFGEVKNLDLLQEKPVIQEAITQTAIEFEEEQTEEVDLPF